MNIREIDHITLTVADVARSERFYHEVFDMPILTDAPYPGVRAGSSESILQLRTRNRQLLRHNQLPEALRCHWLPKIRWTKLSTT